MTESTTPLADRAPAAPGERQSGPGDADVRGHDLGGRGRTSSCSFEVMPASSRPATVTFFSTPLSADERGVSERGRRKRRGVLQPGDTPQFREGARRGEGARPAGGKAGGGRTEPRDQRRHDVLAFPHKDRGARVEHLELRVVVERKRPAITRADVKGAAGARPSPGGGAWASSGCTPHPRRSRRDRTHQHAQLQHLRRDAGAPRHRPGRGEEEKASADPLDFLPRGLTAQVTRVQRAQQRIEPAASPA